MPRLNARPEPVEIDLERTAVVVVDMQNGFASKGGMLDIAGVDISGAPAVVKSIGKVVAAARGAGISIVYLQMGFKPDLSNSGGPESPNWHKELALRLMNCRPELKGKLLVEGTWDFAINGPFNLDFKPPRTTSNWGVFAVSFPSAVDRFITLWEMAGEVQQDPIIKEASEALQAGAGIGPGADAKAIAEANKELLTLHELIAHRLVQLLLGLHRGRTFVM
jgi:hypothetical protein